MQAWDSGYVTDVEYEDGFYAAQSPTRLRLICLLNGIEPPDISSGFTYCELGCGQGGTALGLAAAHPEGEFHAIDFHPSHIAHARARAKAAGLTNVTFHELSFEDLESCNLPMFDIVTMHGVWSWIAPALREAILNFLTARLSPGGLAHVSYNAMPGWSDGAPLQRLLRAFAAGSPGRSDGAIGQAGQMLAGLAEAVVPERMREELARIQDLLRRGRNTYLAHEHLNEHWTALYHLDVAASFGRAKLSYVGSTEVTRNFWNMSMTQDQHALVSSVASPELRETLKDFCRDTRFRTDVYVRGPRRMSQERRRSALGDVQLALLRRAPEAFHLTMPDGNAWRPEPSVYQPILEALETRPRSVSELLALPTLPAQHTVSPVELLGVLIGVNLAAVFRPPTPTSRDAARRLNAVNRAEFDGTRMFVSVPTIGGALPIDALDIGLLDDLQRGLTPNPADLARRFVELCHAEGGYPVIDGKPVEENSEAMRLVTEDYAARIEFAVPIWRTIEMIE
jgi:SAM-dependent methyltransferase